MATRATSEWCATSRMVRNLQNGILRNAYQKSVIRHEAVFVRQTNYLAQLKKSFGLQGVKRTARARRPLLESGRGFHDMQDDETEIQHQRKFKSIRNHELRRLRKVGRY